MKCCQPNVLIVDASSVQANVGHYQMEDLQCLNSGCCQWKHNILDVRGHELQKIVFCFVCFCLSSSLMSQNMQLGFESSTTFLHILNNILDEMDRQHFVYCCWIYILYVYCIYIPVWKWFPLFCSRALLKCGARVQGQEVLWPSDVHSKCCIIFDLIWFDSPCQVNI